MAPGRPPESDSGRYERSKPAFAIADTGTTDGSGRATNDEVSALEIRAAHLDV